MTEKLYVVPIPDDKGVHIKTAGAKGERYVYKYTQYFRNQDGQPRNKAKAIGKVSSEPGMMVPNKNYFELYHTDVQYGDDITWHYGFDWLVLFVSQSLGLTDILSQVFGTRLNRILTMMCYIIGVGSQMDLLPEWQEENYFPWDSHPLYSSEVSRLFESITSVERDQFFRIWIKKISGSRRVCYDVTSVSSYSGEMPSIERGYNRDHESLSQFNLGMFCDEERKIPVYYNRYNGSLSDKSNLSCCLENAKSMGITNVHLILDGGFWSEECIQSLNRVCSAFTVGMPAYLTESQSAIARCSNNIETYANELPNASMYCVALEANLSGISGRILVYFDPLEHTFQCADLSKDIERVRTKLQQIKRYPKSKSKLSYFSKYFVLTKNEGSSTFEYHEDLEKIESLRKEKGYFLLFSNDLGTPPADLLHFYRAKNADEELFSQIKNVLGCDRIRTHNEDTTDGKVFVVFLASIVNNYMLQATQTLRKRNAYSLKRIFAKLSNIKIKMGPDGKRLVKAITKEQREILETFGAYDSMLGDLEGNSSKK